ncbi:unnamed protein product [Rhizophagus irregularis]|uniref:Uncharacterized protein n=2 Tax=Rhizophagus irregularis TaxID=588596 RepID=A0A915ZPB2_9GLOM|nr:hypothetical protein RirG_070840 [Rhizophagus irregularis DAOM 197198w]GBC38677.1 hypothetical protein RIR_jg3982.t1 [Rhizophagus irregularis DAOM 181602=DAOM 197198]CAB4460767.1 unnamed protein product [Rhizophagus irregularis]CAB5164736.1 unnamed protein product [Rhizophagus irregularis]CAB5381972.1 unnamed protein product [Rhizophagus irregularis]
MSDQAKQATQRAADAIVQKQTVSQAAREVAYISSDTSSTTSTSTPSLTSSTSSSDSSSSYPSTNQCKNLLIILVNKLLTSFASIIT